MFSMKKILLSLLVSISLLTGISAPVFADAYVPSIGVRADVEIMGGEIDPETGCSVAWDWCEDCHRKLVVTPYFLKETIESDKSRADIDIAYDMVIASEHVYDLTEEVIPVAHSMGIDEDDLFIRDIFDITTYYCPIQGNVVEITLSTEDLSNYVCLLHYVDGEFEVVPSAYVTIDDHHLFLSVDKLSPFAVVLTSGFNYNPDGEADNNCGNCIIHGSGCCCSCCIWHWLIIITMLLTVIVVQFVHNKDEDEQEENNNEVENIDLEKQEELAKQEEEKEKEEEKKEKRIKRTRDITCIVNLIICIIFYILGYCWLDIYTLIADIIVLVIIVRNTHKKKEDKDDDEKQNDDEQ